MNGQIKNILEKNNIAMLNDVWVVTKSDLQNAIIEICEEQKKQCALVFEEDSQYEEDVFNAKNIAETETDILINTKK